MESRKSREKRLARMRRYRESHREEIRAGQARYRESNREVLRAKTQMYRNAKANAIYMDRQANDKERKEQIKIVKREYYAKYRKHYFAMQRAFKSPGKQQKEYKRLDKPKRCKLGHLCTFWPCIECDVSKQKE